MRVINQPAPHVRASGRPMSGRQPARVAPRQAQQKANEMMTQAQQKTREMRKGASDFSDDLLRRTEEGLAQRLGEVRQARQLLRNPPKPEMPEQPKE